MFYKRWLLPIVAYFVVITATAQIAPPDVPVKSYILLDAASGQVLASKEADVEMPPASITKLMTAYVTFKALKDGKIHLEDKVPVSQNAYSQGGSRMFIEIHSEVPVDKLIQGMIVQSGNDASVALAEYIGGSVEGFVQMMNAQAQRLGLSHTHYVNATGLPVENHYSSSQDIATLARAIIRDFPEYYHYYSQKEFTWNKIKQNNRNLLLWRNANVDGLKTGHTDAAGYCLTASEKRNDLRLIAVVLGAEKKAQRYDAAQALLNFGFAQFSQVSPLKAGQILARVPVFKGAEDEVSIVPAEELTLLLPNAVKGQVKANLKVNQVIAPVTKGQVLGTITITDGHKVYATLPAVAGQNIEKGGFFKRMKDGIVLWWRSE